MNSHRVVSNAQWLAARRQLLAEEKAFTRMRDALSQKRRELPWERVEKQYTFDTATGPQSLASLFEGREQLVVYHFMFAPDWETGCKSCAFWADNFNGVVDHLQQRDVSFVAISRAPLPKLQAFKERMGWHFNCVSSGSNGFNFDYQVSFTAQEIEGDVNYNYGRQRFPATDAPGVSVFTRDEQDNLFHTYSSFSRGIDILNTAYNYLDLVPKGRDEASLPHAMAWVKLHDQYTV